MKKGYLVTVSGILFLGLIISPIFSETHAASKYKWPRSLNITAPSKGPKYFAPLATSGVLEEKTRMKVRITPDEVKFQMLKDFRDGEYDVFVEGSGGPLYFMEGRQEFAVKGNGPLPLTILWPAVIEPFAPMLRGDTEYRTMADLKPGIEFSAPPGAEPQANDHGMAAWAGLKEGEYEIIEYGSMSSAVDAVADGKVDITWWIPDAGETYEAETKPRGLHWLDLDPVAEPEAAERSLEVCPNWIFGEAPETSVASAKGKKIALVATYFFVKKEMDEGLAYNLCKFIAENNELIKEKHPSASSQSLESFKTILDGNFMPLHQGTIKYLKEVGVWNEEHQKRQEFNAKVFDMYVNSFDAAIKEAESKKIKPISTNQEWLEIWERHKKDIPRLKLRMTIPEL